MITVLYDGKCGLCSKEIAYYQKIAPAGIFDWQDITKSTQILDQNNIPLANALKLLHLIDNTGKIYIGVDAFIIIWSHLKKWRILAKLSSLPVIYHFLQFCYKIFANWRFKRLKHCQNALK